MSFEAQTIPSPASATVDLLHRLFEQQAALRPDAIAVECGAQRLTYAELDRRATALAGRLCAIGVECGDRVGLLLPRSAEVYVALLGILKAGAAYVPLDPAYPPDRIAFILGDCQARAVVTSSALANRLPATGNGTPPPQILCLDRPNSALGTPNSALGIPHSALRIPHSALASPLCYIIYTSGTTGRPKGVEIEHRSACHLVRTEAKIFQVRPEDRVYQGFSIAFDASLEEIWLAFFAGATLVAGTDEMLHSGAELAEWLAKAGVTVLSCVPTLLAMTEGELPSLRLLILGGEACPPELVERWWRPNRRVVNTYGPTEATVIATYAECRPERPVTIGRPIEGYEAWILDENLRPAVAGATGELCLGGIGLARGYVRRPELTAEKFITFKPSAAEPPRRLYRTGDRARWMANGELEFLGRLDQQVKLRGFRIELAEIESILLETPAVQAAVVALRQDTPGVQQLVAYLVPRTGTTPDVDAVRSSLRARLPAYMVPAQIEILPALPTLPSGKVDRQRLPLPGAGPSSVRREIVPPATAAEQQLVTSWEKLFAPIAVSVTADFFLDLGGHSLLAARVVSELRRTTTFARVSMLDIYQCPTIRSLAARFTPAAAQDNPSWPLNRQVGPEGRELPARPTASGSSEGTSFWRHFLCGVAQAVSLVFILSFFALQWLAPYLTYTVLVEEDCGFVVSLLGAFASLIVFYPVMLVIPVLAKWLVIGRYRAGSYPLWGVYYFRWWLVTTIEAAVPVGYLAGTPLLNIYARLMGAQIGKNVHLASDSFAIYDLLSIGDDSSINVDSNLLGYSVENSRLHIGSIRIGRDCFVGARAALREDTVMGDGSRLDDLSLLTRGSSIPAGRTWRGSPAQPSAAEERSADAPVHATVRPSTLRRLSFGILHAIGLLIFPVLVVAALFPGIVVMNQLNYLDPYYWYLFLSPLVGLSFIVLLAGEIAALKWLLLGRINAGRYRLHTAFYLRKWFVDQTLDLSLDILGPLYASIYLAPWYRLLGARLGAGAEVSTASFISPDLLDIGDDSFVADNVSLGAARIEHGQMTLGRNRVGKRSFIGNSAILPPETVIGDEVLIGCLSTPPTRAADALRTDTAWLGSPAVFLPQRQKNAAFGPEMTFHPSAKLRAQRAAIEFVRVITPATLFIILLSLMFSALLLLHDSYSLGQTLLFFPPLYLGCGLVAVVLTIVAKWLLVGRYRPGEKPLWSTFVWRNELLNALHEHLAEPFLVGALTGTPFLPWYFRLLGARIGRRVYLETTDFSEFDLAEIGDEAQLNADCTVQTHLFEDRVMKMSFVRIAAHCRVGAGALVLYDTRMEPGSALDDLSLLMKGETLPAGTSWSGSPARSAQPSL